ncbi:MAG: SGNH/GDSL hydrolase family protein [Clostridia bacterium]|jgi:lysophospholipase L1-like esterase|nr:SGNH/GDSL hydrolase family protein [Clostridia bacterium]
MELSGKKINFLGDSITYGVGASCDEMRIPDLVAGMTGAEVRNYGGPGSGFARPCNGYDEFWKRVDEMDADADVIVVFGGTNDFTSSVFALGDVRELTPQSICGAINYTFRKLMEKYPTATIIALTPTHRCCEEVNSYSTGVTLAEVRDAMLKICEYYSVPVIDLWKSSGIYPAITAQRQSKMPDGLHPNDAGMRAIASRIAGLLRSL